MLGTPVDLHAVTPRLKYYNETLFFQARGRARCCEGSTHRMRECSRDVCRGCSADVAALVMLRAGHAADVEPEVHAGQRGDAGARAPGGTRGAAHVGVCENAQITRLLC